VYARWANRTVDHFEAAVADLEGYPQAEAFASGMAAIVSVLLALCQSGDRIAAARQLYGNSYSLLAQRLPRYGIRASFIDIDDLDSWEREAEGARLLYCETIANPAARVADIARLAAIAEAAGIPLVVDNTFASPVLCRPAELGASVVLHSATKFLGGHHDLLGGVACATDELMDPIRALARDFGPTLAPFNAWLALRGMQTLPLRVMRSSDTALEIARWLETHPDIDRVHYPALPSDPAHELTIKQLGGRGGGTMGFDVSGGRERAARFQGALRLIRAAASLGGTHSLIVHAASVTHTQLSSEELASAGITEGFCRLSVGLEEPADLIADLETALRSSA
jgi:cystathionine beta-lyase/cystathionine gamma-synthase